MLRLQHDEGVRWQDDDLVFHQEADGVFRAAWENREGFSYRQISFGAYVLEMIVLHRPLDLERHYRVNPTQVTEDGMTFTDGAGEPEMDMRIFRQPQTNRYVIREREGRSADLSINADGRSSLVVGTFADGAADRFSVIHHEAGAMKFKMNDVVHAIVVPVRDGGENSFKGAGRISQDALLYVTRFSGEDISTMWAVTNHSIERFGQIQ